MTIHVSPRAVSRYASISALTLLPLISSLTAGPTHADISSRDSFIAIQKQVETIEPALVKSTVVIKLSDGSGSGVIISPDGLVLTAGHVVEGRAGRRVTAVLSDGRSLPATVLASNQGSDLGLVKIADVSGLPTAPLGDSSTLRRGEWILATGHPLGQHTGRPPVLRIGRILRVGGGRFGRPMRTVETDAPIISGDSGGPLFDLNGRVVGINSMITTGDRRMSSLHVPINLAKDAVARALHGEEPEQWDGPPTAFAGDLRDGEAALESGDTAAAARLAKEAVDLDQASAAARLLLAHADIRTGQPQLALAAISQACDRGFNDPDALRRDSDFARLLKEPVMAKLLERLDAFNGVPGERKSDTTQFTPGAPRNLGRGVVRVQSSGADVTLGTIMSTDGDILTKASELPDGPLTCITAAARACRSFARAWIPIGMWRCSRPMWPDRTYCRLQTRRRSGNGHSRRITLETWRRSASSVCSTCPSSERESRRRRPARGIWASEYQPVGPEVLKAAGVPQGIFIASQQDIPADRAGVQSGDILYEAEGQPVYDPDAFMDMLVKKKPGDTVTLQNSLAARSA